ncbi:M15 family metallopeptidase [Paenibacillus sp. KN14-4R]|uniref:M15 family metallopeptidase n=1 Tax=Paenibacillus sp. KN14-4R TaxID=3445773 RepID=UPI003F9FF2BB
MKKKIALTALILVCAVSIVGCGDGKQAVNEPKETKGPIETKEPVETKGPVETKAVESAKQSPSPQPSGSPEASKPPVKGDTKEAADPQAITVLVNKQFALPDNYEPKDLVYPSVPFTFNEKIEKRMMRKEAAGALEQMFAGAKKDGISLAGVSAYRSHKTQVTLFNNYVKKDGEAKAKTYSAVPGHSEHETGLAIDVSGSDGKCAAENCFGDTKEAKWLAVHAHEYGFIIRYPKGKESITGYQYEPWHLRYVGKKLAADVAKNGKTLEEVLQAVPVAK